MAGLKQYQEQDATVPSNLTERAADNESRSGSQGAAGDKNGFNARQQHYDEFIRKLHGAAVTKKGRRWDWNEKEVITCEHF